MVNKITKKEYLEILQIGINRFIDERNNSDNTYDWFTDEEEDVLKELHKYFGKHLNEEIKLTKENKNK